MALGAVVNGDRQSPSFAHRRTKIFKTQPTVSPPSGGAEIEERVGGAYLPAVIRSVADCAISIGSVRNCASLSCDCRVRSDTKRSGVILSHYARPAQFSRIVVLWLACTSLLGLAPLVSGDGGSEPDQSYSCPNCLIPHDAIRQYTLEGIKSTILNRLGLSKVPHITNRLPTTEKIIISEFLNTPGFKPDGQHVRHRPHLYDIQSDESQREDEDDDKLRNTHMIAVAKSCKEESYCKTYNDHHPLIFVFEQKTTRARVLSAKLKIYQKQLSSMSKILDADTKVNFTIYKLTARRQYISILSTEKPLSPLCKWIEIDFRENLEKHFKENNSFNLSLVIIATHPNKEIISKLVTEIETEEEPLFPYLQIRTDNQRIKRSKRSNHMDCKDTDRYTSCCRYPLTVDFDYLQWDFIIAPRKYEAYYCTGECSLLSNQKFPHTHLTYLTSPSNNTHLPISPCCTPRKMGPISMVYYGEEGNIHFGVLPGMVVQRCGCA